MQTNDVTFSNNKVFQINDFEKKDFNFKTKFGEALKDGFFYIEIPESSKQLIPKVISFSEALRDNQTLKAVQLGPQLGYQVRQGTQAIAFCAKSNQWQEVYPFEVVQVASMMNELANKILHSALEQLDIPRELWGMLTGGLSEGKGTNVFSLNHYREEKITSPAEKKKIGLIPHKDMGWITVLFINKTGLEAHIEGNKWDKVEPKEGYFVVNFGRAFEILLNSTSKLKASLHRVRHVADERISFGIFINHTEGTSVYQMNERREIVKQESYQDYLSRCFSEFAAVQKQFQEEEVKE